MPKVVTALAVLGSLLVGVTAVGLPLRSLPAIVGTVDKVVDGVTVEVRLEKLPSPAPAGLSVGKVVRVRYLGLDPRDDPTQGNPAALNAILVLGRSVYLELDGPEHDPQGNLLAYVYLDPDGRLMVNLILLASGLFKLRPEPTATRYAEIFSHAAATPAPRGTTCASPVLWNAARDQIGQTLCVEGPVMSVGTSRGGDVFLNLGHAFPNPERFTLFIPARHVGKFEAAFGAKFWTGLVGKRARAYGVVRLYQGVAEIVLSDPQDLYLQR